MKTAIALIADEIKELVNSPRKEESCEYCKMQIKINTLCDILIKISEKITDVEYE